MSRVPSIPGALNLTEGDLTGLEIIGLGAEGPTSAQTTLEKLAGYFSGGDGRAVLFTPERIVISAPIVSKTARTIQNIAATVDGTTYTVTARGHPFSTGTRVNMRVGGWNGLTKAAHPANGLWTITKVDENSFVLNSSTVVANSVLLHGICWSGSLVDAQPSISALCDIIIEDGPSTLQLPAGICALLTAAGPSSGIVMPAGLRMVGRGPDVTSIFAGDNLDVFLLQSIGTSDLTLQDFALYGNRQNQARFRGFHAIRYGAQGVHTDNCQMINLRILGSAGYGIGLQSEESSFSNFVFSQIYIDETDSDGIDVKNRAQGNVDNRMTNITVNNIGMNKIGINYPDVRLVANPFTTTNLSSIVTVAHVAHNYRVGIAVTFSGALPFNGVTGNGTVTILTVATDSYTVDFGQVANAPGVGGGSNVLENASMFSEGDAGIDMRGVRWTVSDISGTGDYQSRSAVRLRFGEPTGFGSLNGLGGWNSTVSNVSFINTGLALNSSLVFDGGSYNTITNCVGVNFAIGAFMAPTTRFSSVSNVVLRDGSTCVYMQGEDISVSGCVADNCDLSFATDGGEVYDDGDFGPNAFATTQGSATVTATLVSHGLAPTDTISIYAADNFNGVVVNGVNRVVVSTPTADTFTFVVGQLATASGSGGGDTAVWRKPNNLAHTSKNIVWLGCISNSAATAGYSIGPRSTDMEFVGCQSVGDTIARTGALASSNVVWSSRQFSDLKQMVSLPTAGTTNPTTLTEADSGKTFYVPTNATEQAVVILPNTADRVIGWNVTLMVSHASLGCSVVCPLGGIRVGTVSAGSNVPVKCSGASSVGNSLVLECRTASGYQATGVIGTWTL
jgi:hypothetical protein